MEASAKNNLDTLVGRLVVEQGLATAKDVQECVERNTTSNDNPNQRTLSDFLVADGIVTQKQIERLLPLIEEARPTQQIPGYQILSKIGSGAMATVYKARQLSLDRLVAIKVLPRKHTNNPEFVKRFYAEGRAAAKLNHTNIVGALDVGKAGDYHYFVMEYVEGRTLHDDIAAGKPYLEKDALVVMIQTVKALEHAHKAGFVHRDVKPKNIMITQQGVAKLADMGLARAVSDREAAEAEQGKAYGTPYYISPEQVRGEKEVDARADIYSLGATLYHLVTGQVPYDGPNPSAVMHQHLKADMVPPDRINPKLSAGVCEIIELCLQKNREDRYQTAGDLLEDLYAVYKGLPPIQARKKFDISSLTSLEPQTAKESRQPVKSSAGPSNTSVKLQSQKAQSKPFFVRPLFILAVIGWTIAVSLFITLLYIMG